MRRRSLLFGACVPVISMAAARPGPLDLSRYELSFSSDFGNPKKPLLRYNGGPFSARFEEWGGLRTLPGNKEEQLYVDTRFVPNKAGTDKLGQADAPAGSEDKPLGVNPFSFVDGALEISAIQAPPMLQQWVDRRYLSGMLCTDRFFEQRYGYFELRGRLPGGRGLWPAFWLVSKGQEHVEIDVMEAVGWDTAHVYQSTHLKPSRGKGVHVRVGDDGFDYSTGMHSYGVEWTPEWLVFYIDGRETTRTDGRPFRDVPPMYMIANLAVGGEWAGTPENETTFPAVMRIAHIRAYQPR